MSTHSAAIHPHGGARTYAAVLAALLALTAITVFVAGFDFGSLNVIVALGIATIKGSLVALFFMHLKDDKPMYSIILVGGLIALGFFLALSVIDSGSRDPVRPSKAPPAQRAWIPASPADHAHG